MPWAGGTYSRGYPSWSADAAGNLPISATKFDTEDNDFATGINFCLAKDGSNSPTASLAWSLASAAPLALTRTTTDGTVFSLARTGGANNPVFSFTVGDTAGLTIGGAGGGLNVLNAGNVSVAAPTSGIALSATGFANSYTALLTGASASGQSLGLQIKAGSTTADFALNVQNQAGTTTFMTIDGTGRQVKTLPDNVRGITVNVASAVQGSFLSWQNSGVERGFLGTGPGTLAGAALADFIIGADTGVLRLAVGSTTAIAIANAGNVTIAAPSSGNALAITGLANAKALRVNGAGTAGQSYGIQVAAGTNTSDLSFEVLNQAGSTDYFYVQGDGSCIIGAPSGTTGGVGTLNVQNGISLNNNPIYAGIPQNLQTVSYVLVLTDANKHIHHGSASPHTFTIPANASVAFPVGTAVTFTNGSAGGVVTIAITTDTLQWAPSGSTGSRTMTGCSTATAIKVSSNVWIITGSGLS